MNEYNKRWFIYRRMNGNGITIDIKRENRMIFPWLFGWKLINIVDYSIPEKKKE